MAIDEMAIDERREGYYRLESPYKTSEAAGLHLCGEVDQERCG